MSVSDLHTEIRRGEGKRLEMKRTLPASEHISKTAIAFSNMAGGKLIIGVEDRTAEIIGISESAVHELPDRISNIVYETCHPTIIPEIYTVTLEGRTVLIAEFFSGNLKPYYLTKKGKRNGTYIRVGATNKMADIEMIQELERQRRNITFDSEPLLDRSVEDLDIEPLNEFLADAIGKEIGPRQLDTLRFVQEVAGARYPTRAGVMLCGRRSVREELFEYARIKCARFKGTTTEEFIDNKCFDGLLYEQIENAMAFAKVHIPLSGRIDEGGVRREDTYEVPLIAIREALVNAVVHRDYSLSGSDIKFAIFDDIIEITSPGALPKSLDVHDLETGGRSEIRNKVIARFFQEVGYIEQWGTGIRKIIDSCRAYGLKKPTFREAGLFVQVTIYRKLDPHGSTDTPSATGTGTGTTDTTDDRTDDRTDNRTDDRTDNRTDDRTDNSTSTERLILDHLRTHHRIDNQTARKLTGLTASGVKYIFRKLTKRGVIEKSGIKKQTTYSLVDEDALTDHVG